MGLGGLATVFGVDLYDEATEDSDAEEDSDEERCDTSEEEEELSDKCI